MRFKSKFNLINVGVKVFKKLTVLSLLLLVANSAFAVDLSNRLMGFAGRDPGHKALESHVFISSLNKGSFKIENVAQFIQDRVYYTQNLESILEQPKRETFIHSSFYTQISDLWEWVYNPTAFKARQSNSEIQYLKKLVFFRSIQYQKEAQKLIDAGLEMPVSSEAKQYGEYLKTQEKDIVAIHLWLFLVGETFGAQPMGRSIHNKYSELGQESTRFDGVQISEARVLFNNWLLTQIDASKVDDYKVEIGRAYEYLIKTFEAAQNVSQKNEDGIEYALLEKSFRIKNYFKEAQFDGKYFSYVTEHAGLAAIDKRNFQDKLCDNLNAYEDYDFLVKNKLVNSETTVEEFIKEYFPEISH
jgi:hypothetical protein